MSASVINCPTCGASLPREREQVTAECRYCGTAVETATRERAAVVDQQPSRGRALLYAAIGVPAVLLGVLAAVVLSRRNDPQGPATPSGPSQTQSAPIARAPPASQTAPPAASSAAPDPAALADVTLEFGEKGSGPGQLDDPRAIAVDLAGNIYVADYRSGRVQKFDSSGKFVAAFLLGEDMIHGVAATYDGHLWVSRGGDLIELALPDGKVVRTLPNHQPKLSYGGLAVDQSNTIYAANYGAGTFVSINGSVPRSDDIRKLDKNGNLLAIWKDIIRGSMGAYLAVDSAGALYVAEERSRYIDIVDSHGKVKERFQHHTIAEGIAVDGKGRILVGTGRGISVFDGTGQSLGTIGTATVRGVAMGRNGRLHAVSSEGRVQVLTLR